MQPLKLVIYSDYVCPWCYVGQAPVERLKAERPVEVDWATILPPSRYAAQGPAHVGRGA